jgi:hypothetical protein
MYNLIYNSYVSHNKGVLWYTRGYIPDISPRGCGGLAELRTGSNKKYTKVPNSYAHKNNMLACIGQFYLVPSWAMSCLIYTHIPDMLAFAGYLKILFCPLWLYRHFAS